MDETKYSYARICCENFYARKLYIFGRWEKICEKNCFFSKLRFISLWLLVKHTVLSIVFFSNPLCLSRLVRSVFFSNSLCLSRTDSSGVQVLLLYRSLSQNISGKTPLHRRCSTPTARQLASL
jgi:hypothetical protein